MAEQSVLLSGPQAKAILALVAEEKRLKIELQEIGKSYNELGRLYAREHQLPSGEYSYRGEGDHVRLVVNVPEEVEEADGEHAA